MKLPVILKEIIHSKNYDLNLYVVEFHFYGTKVMEKQLDGCKPGDRLTLDIHDDFTMEVMK